MEQLDDRGGLSAGLTRRIGGRVRAAAQRFVPPPPQHLAVERPKRLRRAWRPLALGLLALVAVTALLALPDQTPDAAAQSMPMAWIHGEHRQLVAGSDSQIYELGDVDEGVAAVFTVNISAVQSAAVTVNVLVSESTGGARDYLASANEKVHQVVIAAGDTSADLSVPTLADSSDEATGRVTAAIQSGNGYSVSSGVAHRKASAGIDVYDDDATSVRLTGWSGRGVPGSAVSIVGRTISFAEQTHAEVVLEVGRPLVAGESLRVPVLIGGSADVGCNRVACDDTMIEVGADVYPDATLSDHEPFPTTNAPGRSRVNKDLRWGFRGLGASVSHNDGGGAALFMIDMPDNTNGESPTEFRLRVATWSVEQSVTGEQTETVTFRLEHRPTTDVLERGVESRGLARYTPGSGDYGGSHVAANAQPWTMYITDSPAPGDVHFMDETSYGTTNVGDTHNCVPHGSPAKVVLTEGTLGKWCDVYLEEEFGSVRVPPLPLVFTVTTSNANVVKLEHGIEGATPGSIVAIRFAKDNDKSWGVYHAVRLVPQTVTGTQTATITQRITGGGPEYASVRGTRSFTVEVRDAPAGQSQGTQSQGTQSQGTQVPPPTLNSQVKPPSCTPNLPSDAVTVSEVTGWRDAHSGAAHVLRWNQVLEALGEDTGSGATALTVAESTANESKFMATRWNRVTRTLKALADCPETTDSPPPPPESDSPAPPSCTPTLPSDAVTVSEVTGWRDAHPGAAHVLRWNQVLAALGEDVGVDALTVEQSKANEDTYMRSRWNRVTRTLEALSQCP